MEREVESYWTALYFQQQQQANPRAIWQAMFLCWFKQDVGECAGGMCGSQALSRAGSMCQDKG